eukprot:2636548-Rhodomonas_salina.2
MQQDISCLFVVPDTPQACADALRNALVNHIVGSRALSLLSRPSYTVVLHVLTRCGVTCFQDAIVREMLVSAAICLADSYVMSGTERVHSAP